ncbi:MAG: hypothetical protein J0L84_17230, partial [Verrucomicrobia bacterium]|nr:hypothetical protein [Verrucomicrobiota bacterium]
SVTIAGSLDTLPNAPYQLDFYANRVADPSLHGEGEQYLGSQEVRTDAGGDATFEVTFPVTTVGILITATATDAAGNSSEFSEAFKASSSLGGQTFVVTHTGDTGPGSLRQAILDSNATPTSGNRIEFDIPGDGIQVIQPATALPEITTAVTLDGHTQPGARANTLADGNDAVLRIHLVSPPATFGAGLVVSDSGSVVRGLAISGFAPGIALRGTNNTVAGCWIGLAPDGTERQNFQGLLLDLGRRNRVGGESPADRNVISGNRDGGIRILAPETVVAGNFIGTDPTGRTARSNGGNGIEILNGGDVTIGGAVASARNVIGGHLTGIQAIQVSTLLIANNHIGVDVTGTNALGNSTGVELSDVINARVDANVISANRFLGVSVGGSRDGNNVLTGNAIGTDRGGTLRLGNARTGIQVFGTTPLRIGGLLPGEANLIAFNEEDGIAVPIRDATVFIRANRIFSNAHLGIDRGDNGPASNDPGDAQDPTNAPRLTEATLNEGSVQVRGVMEGAASASYRMDFFASPAPDPSGVGEGAQFLGSITHTTDATGAAPFEAAFPEVASGRWITATATDALGDTSEFSAALRAGSTRPSAVFTVTTTEDDGPGSLRQALVLADGIFGAENTRIRFQIPGSGPFLITPQRPLPVPVEPVTLDGFTQPGAAANQDPEGDDAQRSIQLVGGGLEFGAPGLVLASQGNLVRGVTLRGFDGPAIELRGDSNRVEGCLIESNRFSGIQVALGSGHQIGGPLPAHRNRFAANPGGHVVADGTAGGGLRVQGNFIGVGADGRLDPQRFDLGVLLASTGPSLIGGPLPGEANWISGANPVSITGGRGHAVRGNRALSNGNPIPDLPVFGNDPGDADEGPNDLQNSPTVTSATVTALGTRVAGTLNSRPSSSFVLDFYSIPTNQNSGVLLLERHLGSATVTTDATGDVAFDLTLPQKARRGRILATATDAGGSTSETGASALTTTEIPPPQLAVTRATDAGPGSLRAALQDSEDIFATGPGTIAFNIPGAGPHRIQLQSPLPRLTQAVTLDGFTQPGAISGPATRDVVLQVGLDGTALGPGADGLVLTGDRFVVRGLIFTGFDGTGLVLSNAPGSTLDRNWFGFDGSPAPAPRAAAVPQDDAHAYPPFQTARILSERSLGSAIEVIGADAFTFDHDALTQILGNVVANTRDVGIHVQQAKDLRLLGNTVGMDLDGFRHGGEIGTGIQLDDVSRVEVLRGPVDSPYGRNVIGGAEIAIVMRKVRESRLEDAILGGGAFGDWQLANGTALVADTVQVTEFVNNDLSFNERGAEVWGEGFGTQFRGNRFGDDPEFGLFGGPLARGYRLGDFQ